jgi:hypothetical protein
MKSDIGKSQASSSGIDTVEFNQLEHDHFMSERKDKNWFFAKSIDIISHKWFSKFINLIIVANTVVLAQDRYLIEPALEEKLEMINLIFFVIFTLEMIVKVIGLGPKMYIKDNFNIFDASIVLISMVDVMIYYQLETEKSDEKAIDEED